MNKKTFIKCVQFMFIISFFVYLGVSFVEWNFNPNKWQKSVRGMFIGFSLLFYCLLPILLHEEK